MIFIAGGTGFIGKRLLAALREKGHGVRCLVRTQGKARIYEGFEAAIGDITDRESLRGKLEGADMVVHLVGIIMEKGLFTFEKVHVEGTSNIVEEAKAAGIKHFFYQSALGADINSWAKYLKTKAEAEKIVRESGIPFTIFRPSLVVGDEDGFTKMLRTIISSPSPFIPVPGKGKAKLQPLYVDDWVKCFMKIIDNPEAIGKVYEFGGPEHIEYNDIVKAVADAVGVKKPLMHIPAGIAGLGARLLEKTPFMLATSEQLKLLNIDNICDRQGVKRQFGFEPVRLKDALKLFISR